MAKASSYRNNLPDLFFVLGLPPSSPALLSTRKISDTVVSGFSLSRFQYGVVGNIYPHLMTSVLHTVDLVGVENAKAQTIPISPPICTNGMTNDDVVVVTTWYCFS